MHRWGWGAVMRMRMALRVDTVPLSSAPFYIPASESFSHIPPIHTSGSAQMAGIPQDKASVILVFKTHQCKSVTDGKQKRKNSSRPSCVPTYSMYFTVAVAHLIYTRSHLEMCASLINNSKTIEPCCQTRSHDTASCPLSR